MAGEIIRWEPPAPKQWDTKEPLPPEAADQVANWPAHYPPIHSREANVKWRRKIWDGAAENPKVASYLRKMCSKDSRFWFAGFCWIFETRRSSAGRDGVHAATTLPYIPFPYQFTLDEELRASIDGGYDIAIPKSRDMGITWACLLTIQWYWMFRQGFSALLLSKKESYVDQLGSPNTLFEKLRFNLRRQPRFMVPDGYRWDGHSKLCQLENPEMGSTIEGEATTPDSGRSGRYNVILCDEHAFLERSQAEGLETATADASPCRWYLSTPNGEQNTFHRKCHGGSKRIDIHWSLHPFKGRQQWMDFKIDDTGRIIPGRLRSPWYDHEVMIHRKDQSPWMIAQELDIQFMGSLATIFDTDVLRYWRDHKPQPLRELLQRYRTDKQAALLIFEDPIKGVEYIIGGDMSGGGRAGAGTAFKTVQVFKLPTFEQVAEFQGTPGVEIMGSVIWWLGKMYNTAFLCIEQNNGMSVIADLTKGHLDHDGICGTPGAAIEPYPTKRIARHVSPKTTMETGKPTKHGDFGIQTSTTTKPYMVLQVLEPMIRMRNCEIRGERTINELSGFSQDGAQYRNPDGDDLVLAFMMAAYGFVTCWRPPENYGRLETNTMTEGMMRDSYFEGI